MDDDKPATAVKPIAFMVMPFGEKDTNVPGRVDVPDKIDFDVLWNEVFYPLLVETHTPIRADQDMGSLIVVEMIQRLTAADLVLAEVTILNPNVYYEIGVRHAARRAGCVLVAADWATQAFDLAQIRQLRYPLPSGPVTEAVKQGAREALSGRILDLARSGSPVYEAVPGFPTPNELELSSFQDYAREMTEFHDRVSTIRLRPTEKAENTQRLVEEHPPNVSHSKAVAWEILTLIRDHLGMAEVVAYVEQLPPALQGDSDIQEQLFLALAKAGDPHRAVARLETMIDQLGQTPERCGLLGGRYKQLFRAEPDPESPRAEGYLRKAIDSYETGMYADLNEYYCSSNLPRLYRTLGGADAEFRERADEATMITLAACKRTRWLEKDDEWALPTLLVMAFELGDLQEVTRLVREIQAEDWADWKLDTVIADLRTSLGHHDVEMRGDLQEAIVELEQMIGD
ncbi:MAG: tetratricopeptide repeat-containing protein [Acidimicrobiales bacterium]